MNFIFPILLFIASIGVFFGYVDPNYRSAANEVPGDYTTYSVVDLQNELAKYQDLSASAKSVVAEENDLVNKANTISTDDQTKLARMLPANVDNLRLIIEISQIASSRGLAAQNFSVTTGVASSVLSAGQSYGTLAVSFSVANASYSDFLGFLSALEQNLRLVDITNISFSSNDTGLYTYDVTLNTYWLQ
ncbi:MAG: type 4a pilus biogenesis protein PilO [Patescibacteria group bacterium]|nr:type 4a pilus biogenesis protein PilO [Patescibacteria group bacterium]MDE1945629.1 type 4a pilus biogenesis protein PilO [Patescibacteria group bacterium]